MGIAGAFWVLFIRKYHRIIAGDHPDHSGEIEGGQVNTKIAE
jgi:hypothetical protein